MKVKLLSIFIFGLFTVFSQSGSSSVSVTGSESILYSVTDSKLSSQTFALAAVASDLTVTVKNVNATVRSAAQVKLYNADYSLLLNTLFANSSGQVVFAGLSDGTYNYDVSYTPSTVAPLAGNTEFWGSGQVTINGSSQSVSFTRNQPYISAEANFSPAQLNPGQSTSGSFTVKNALSYTTDSYVTVWIDRDKTNPWDFAQYTLPKTIIAGSTSAFPFTAVPSSPGTYYYYAFVYSRVNSNYVITDQYSWTQTFVVGDPSINISIGLFDHNNAKALAGNKILRYDQLNNFIDSKLTDSNGQVSWSDISAGTYIFEGYNTALNSLWGGDLYWGKSQGVVSSGTANTLKIIQSEPYIESVAINGTVFGPGSTVHVDVTVSNPGSVAKICKADIKIDRDKYSAYDFESGFQGPLTIPPGGKMVFGYDWTIPLNTPPATFYVSSRVQTSYDKGYSNSDATNWDYSITNENTSISQIQWSGYTWNVKNGAGLGPGPNNWLGNSSSVWVDVEGNLHLKIRKIGDKWYCAEISSLSLIGYGDYIFQISTNVENLDKNIVLGLFTYESDTREIDIEFTRWGDSANQAGWYVVQPASSSNHKNFSLNLSGGYSTHKFRWKPSEIFFQSYNGHYQYLPSNDLLISQWSYTGPQIPPDGNERVILNLWLNKGTPPSDLKEAEVVIKSFTFKKVGDLSVQVLDINNTSTPVPGSNGTIKLYNSENSLVSTQQTDQNGIVTFAGLPEGTNYFYRVFYNQVNPVSIYGQEYWGSKTAIQVISSQTTNSIFKRDQPYNGTVKAYSGTNDVTGQLVEPNTVLRIEQQIINPASQIRNARGSMTLDIDKIAPYNNQLTYSSFTSIPANSAITQSWTITPTEKGQYYLNAGVQTLLNNDTLFCDTGTWSTLPLFGVSPAFNLNLISAVEQKVTQNSTANWLFNLKNTGSVNDYFSLNTDKGAFYYQGKQIVKTPVLLPNEEINLELRVNSEMVEIGTNSKTKLLVFSNNDQNRKKEIEVIYTIVVSDIVLTTNNINSITHTSATGGGAITSVGATPISAKGVCWGTTDSPTVYLDTKTIDGSGTTAFVSNITGLTAGTTYHARAYAVNSLGAAYGNDVVFTTVPIKPPVANFSAIPTTSCSPMTVQFSDQSSENPTSWSWDVDNNGSIDYTTQNPIHTFGNAGNYSVKLTVYNISGSDSKTLTNYITVNPFVLPDVRISAFPSETIVLGDLVTFTANPTNGGTNPKYQWKIDGAIVGDNNPSYETTKLTNRQIVTCEMTSNYPCVISETVGSNPISMKVSFPINSAVISIGNGIKVYPNPTSGIITIEGLPANKKSSLCVFSAAGKLVTKKITVNSKEQLDLSKELPGAYELMINSQTIKIVKQ